MAYLVTYGIAPDFHQALIDCLHEKDFYSILFDESFNKTLQEEQMDVLVRYWHVDHVITCYFGSAFLGHTIAEDLLEAINDVVCPLDRSKIVQMGMDGPNTNIKMMRLLVEESIKYDRDCCFLIAKTPFLESTGQ